MWVFGSPGMRRKSEIVSMHSKFEYARQPVLQFLLVVSTVLFVLTVVGQEDDSEELDAGIEEEEASTADSTANETSEESESSIEDSEERTTEVSDEESSDAETTNNEETEESDDTNSEVFIPTEQLSEDIPIAFPVDI